MSAEQIEAAVAVKQPLDKGDLSQPLKLFGEDAILDWPVGVSVEFFNVTAHEGGGAAGRHCSECSAEGPSATP